MRTHDLPVMSFTHTDLQLAREELTAFVELMADKTEARAGIGWIGTPEAPNTWNALSRAWEDALLTGAPLPVSNTACENVILLTPAANVAYRFWHDVTHLERGRNFSNAHELDMANFHLWEAERHGVERGSLPWRLLYADAVGNVLHWAALRRFVSNQLVFIVNVVQYGMEAALLAEMARHGLLHPQVLPFGVDFTTDSAHPMPPSDWARWSR